MDAAAWLAQNAQLRTTHRTFECLAGCGFCCTYPPEVSRETWEIIAKNTGLKRVTVDADGTNRLPLQGGCGACVVLKDRRCTDYEDRPKHCRLFPFHVYFGRTVEVYANRVCPGLDATNGKPGPLPAAIATATRTVQSSELERKRAEARSVHATFEARARDAGVWVDVDAARRELVPRASITEDAWKVVLGAFRAADEVLPTMVLAPPAFEWRTWRLRRGRFERVRFEEDGTFSRVGTLDVPGSPDALSPVAVRVLERLAGYESFVGAAFDLVDASGYEMPVRDAVEHLVAELAAGLAVREPLLRAEGLPVDERWLSAAYEPEFYDLPTIGGWL